MGAIQSTVRKLDKTTYCIDQFDVHLYLFLGKERALLLDTGFSDADDLMAAIAGITSLPLVVANSHGHPDHSGGNHKFGQVYAHPDGFARVREYQQGECKLLPLNEGDTLDLGGRVFEAVSIPGHQEGAIALLCRAEGLLAPGDNVCTTPVAMYLPGVDLKQYIQGLEKLEGLSDCFSTILPSHGEIPVDKGQIGRLKACAQACLAGQLAGTPAVGPDGTPCQAYTLEGATLYF